MFCTYQSWFLPKYTFIIQKRSNLIFPHEILRIIFSNLAFYDLLRTSLVCKQWHKICNENYFRLKLYINLLRILKPTVELKHIDKPLKMNLMGLHQYVKLNFNDLITELYSDSVLNSSLKLTIIYYHGFVVEKSIKAQLLNFISCRLFMNRVRNYTQFRLVTDVKIDWPLDSAAAWERRLLIEVQKTINRYVEQKTKKFKRSVIDNLIKDARS